MFTLSNTGKTITFGGDNETLKKLMGERIKIGYDQVKKCLILTPTNEGMRISPDKKGSNSYLCVQSKRLDKLPTFGRISADKLIPIENSKSFYFPIPEHTPYPSPLKDHEKEFNGRKEREGKEGIHITFAENTPALIPTTNAMILVEGETLSFNLPSKELLESMIKWVKAGYSV